MAPLSKAKLAIIDAHARTFIALGSSKSIGQIYGLLALSSEPLTLDDISALLKISKGSTSLGTRFLMSTRAIRQVWKPGDRKDFFQIESQLSDVALALVRQYVDQRMAASRDAMEKIEAEIALEKKSGALKEAEAENCRATLEKISKIEECFGRIVPIIEKLLTK